MPYNFLKRIKAISFFVCHSGIYTVNHNTPTYVQSINQQMSNHKAILTKQSDASKTQPYHYCDRMLYINDTTRWGIPSSYFFVEVLFWVVGGRYAFLTK